MTCSASLIQLSPGLFLVDGLPSTRAGWLTLVWVIAARAAGHLPLGAVLGSLFDEPAQHGPGRCCRSSGWSRSPASSTRSPQLPGWLQGIAQVFPVYWLGLGMRSALLPDALAAVELGALLAAPGDVGVAGRLGGARAGAGPAVLRRMARRESGSAVAARRERAMLRRT